MSLKLLVNDVNLWGDFLSELDKRIADCYKKLEQVNDINEVFRTQGEIQALRKLQKLRDKVNSE
jgi:hypothetical protein